MRIFLISPIYAVTTQGSGATPVVHYFAKEWVKQGHQVHVFNLQARFPKFFYFIGKNFQHILNTRLGMLVPTDCPTEGNSVVDGVDIHNLTLPKCKPHSRISKKNIDKAIDAILKEGTKVGKPDLIIGHWHNPQLEVLSELKKYYNVKNALVLHTNNYDLESHYGVDLDSLISNIDVLGFRNKSALEDYKSKCINYKPTFIASSGVSPEFIEAGNCYRPDYSKPITSYVYVGSLIARKHPAAVVKSLNMVNPDVKTSVTFVGDGAEKTDIEQQSAVSTNIEVNFTGRIPRTSIIEVLKKSQILVMISKDEIFGLVYLEAMAMGLIPIGSRNEGIDGIIVDGYNGFLCEAGNETELAGIIMKINLMSHEELQTLSNNARATALEYSDSKVAERYLTDITRLI